MTSQLWTDSILISSLLHWLQTDNSWRFPSALTLVLLSCWSTRKLYALRAPEMCAWNQTAIPSLLVWYGCIDGAFFNLQTAVLTVCWCQLRHWGLQKNCVVILGIAMQVYLLIMLRGCYWVDILGGLVIGEMCAFFAERWISTVVVDFHWLALSNEERCCSDSGRCAQCQTEFEGTDQK